MGESPWPLIHTKCLKYTQKQDLFRLGTGEGYMELKFNGWDMENKSASARY